MPDHMTRADHETPAGLCRRCGGNGRQSNVGGISIRCEICEGTGAAVVTVIDGSAIAKFVRSYQFEPDEGVKYTPTFVERAICSFLADRDLLVSALEGAASPLEKAS